MTTATGARLLAVVAVAAGGLWTWISRPAGQAMDVRQPAPHVGAPAPDFSLLTVENGKPVRLADLRGHIVVLNFWATWCLPCRTEMPALDQAQRNMPDAVVLGVNQQEGAETVGRFLREQGLDFAVVLDTAGEVNRLYRVLALPTTYFIDRDGVIREVVYGGPLTRALIESKVAGIQ